MCCVNPRIRSVFAYSTWIVPLSRLGMLEFRSLLNVICLVFSLVEKVNPRDLAR